VVALGGVGVHIPYHLTWVHERDDMPSAPGRVQAIDDAGALHDALAAIEQRMSAGATPGAS
jgi:putative hydrolase of the HAD superfamily